MGIYHLKGEAVFVFNPQTKPLVVNAQISLPHLAEIQLSFPIINNDKRAKSLLQAVLGNVSEISVELMDTGLFQKYTDYSPATIDELVNISNGISTSQQFYSSRSI